MLRNAQARLGALAMTVSVSLGLVAAVLVGTPSQVKAVESLTESQLSHKELVVGQEAPELPAMSTGRSIVSFLASGTSAPSKLLQAFWEVETLTGVSLLVHVVGPEELADPASLVSAFGVESHLPVTFFLEQRRIVYRRTGFFLADWTDFSDIVAQFCAGASFEPPDIESNLLVGAPLAEVQLASSDGIAVAPPGGSSPSVILITSPMCKACERLGLWASRFISRYQPDVEWYSLVLDAYDSRAATATEEALTHETVRKIAPTSEPPALPSLEDAVAYATTERLPGHIVVDLNGLAKRVLGIGGVPALLILDPEGRVVAKYSIAEVYRPSSKDGSLEATILSDLAGLPDNPP